MLNNKKQDTLQAKPIVNPDDPELPPSDSFDDIEAPTSDVFELMEKKGAIRVFGPYNQNIRDNADLRASFVPAPMPAEATSNMTPE
jgi:hypothetical protein